MRILDMQGNELANPDLELGHLVSETLYVDHPATEEVPEVRDIVTVWQNPKNPANKIIKSVVTQKHIPARDAWREPVESIYRYIPYTPEELAEREEQRAAAEAAAAASEAEAARKAELQEKIEALPEQMEGVYEALAEVGGAVGENDDLIAELRSDLDDTMEAIAELGTLVAGEE